MFRLNIVHFAMVDHHKGGQNYLIIPRQPFMGGTKVEGAIIYTPPKVNTHACLLIPYFEHTLNHPNVQHKWVDHHKLGTNLDDKQGFLGTKTGLDWASIGT